MNLEDLISNLRLEANRLEKLAKLRIDEPPFNIPMALAEIAMLANPDKYQAVALTIVFTLRDGQLIAEYSAYYPSSGTPDFRTLNDLMIHIRTKLARTSDNETKRETADAVAVVNNSRSGQPHQPGEAGNPTTPDPF